MKHQSTRAIFDYWNKKRGSRPAPARADIDPAEIRHALSDTFMLAADFTDQLRFRLAGTWIGSVLGTELTHLRPLDLQPPQFGAMVQEHYAQCVNERRPMLHKVEIDSVRRIHSYARLLLPLSSDGEQVDMLMTVDSRA